MKKVFLIHGYGGIPNGGWLSWLMAELGKKGIYACSLPMPNTNNPNLSEWLDMMHSCIREVNEDIYIVGHSLGGPAVLRYLESLKENNHIGGVLLVSPFIEPLETDNQKSNFRAVDNFVVPEINFEKIKNIPNTKIIIHGKKDNIVPFSHSEKIADKMTCEFVLIPEGDHFSQKTDPICYELPEALDAILKMIGSSRT